MNLIDGWMPYSMKHLRKVKMTNDNIRLLDKSISINNNLEKLGKTSKKISDQVGLIWLTIVGFIIYLEFFK